MKPTSQSHFGWLGALALSGVAIVGVAVAEGTRRNPHFWLTADQMGERFAREKRFAEAAKAYDDPWRIGVAQYRNGDFEAAARTFAGVPGAVGAYNQGNAWLMRGNYAAAIASYEHALAMRPGWKEPEENMAIAIARRARIEGAGKNAPDESASAYDPDKIVFDRKAENKNDKPLEMGEQEMSDEALRARWLRHVRTTPADFLRTKFAYQAAQRDEQP